MSAILNLVKYLSLKYINKNSITLDATCGNGYDSLFLAQNSKKVYAFDIQKMAIERAKEKTKDFKNITFIHDSHENIDKYINEKLNLVLYNLGYLPNSDKKIITKFAHTKASIEKSIKLLNKKSAIIITAYPGTDDGKLEAESLLNFFENYDRNFDVFLHRLINKINNPPFIIEIINKG